MKRILVESAEDPLLMRDILIYLARRDTAVHGPVEIDELQKELHGVGRDMDSHYWIRDHIGRLIELELVEVQDWTRRVVGDPDDDSSGFIDTITVALHGLTPKGREYAKQARTGKWAAALAELEQSGQQPSTATLIERLLDTPSG